MEASEKTSQQPIEEANAVSLQAIKDTYLTVVNEMRGGPWIGCL